MGMSPSEMARALAKLPRKKEGRVCVVCGAAFASERGSRQYCSDACRARAYYHRQRQQQAEQPPGAG